MLQLRYLLLEVASTGLLPMIKIRSRMACKLAGVVLLTYITRDTYGVGGNDHREVRTSEHARGNSNGVLYEVSSRNVAENDSLHDQVGL